MSGSSEGSRCPSIGTSVVAAAAETARKREEDSRLGERTRQLVEGAQRVRESAIRMRSDSRRVRHLCQLSGQGQGANTGDSASSLESATNESHLRAQLSLHTPSSLPPETARR